MYVTRSVRAATPLGVDDEVSATSGSVVFQVWSGETKLYDSGVRTGADPALPVRVDMTGRTELRLVVTDAGDGPSSDHADWAEARCDTNAPPVVTIAAPRMAAPTALVTRSPTAARRSIPMAVLHRRSPGN